MIAIFWKDMRLSFGAGGGFGQGLGFFLIVIFLIGLALGPQTALLRQIAPSVLFISVLLSGILSLDRLFKSDLDDGSLAQLRLSPVPFFMVVFMKSLAHWISSGLAMTLITPIICLALGMENAQIWALFWALLLGSPALSFIGAIGAALTLSIARASLIQAIVTLPFYIPTLIYGTLAAQIGSRQMASLALLGGLSLLSLIFAPWIAAKTLERHQI